ncbi:hypothetical protein BDQ12DRAFT_249620 [Crucibulum laeve]|uniref:Secreted protein n=1 Tax=Crucibulum laeve TaxID=68775 RepID=A0A5C3LUD2_9AGAR|nr:hypothetical protein BDQ12DRAFT_249620 [Crucibulum laeve]
MKEQNFKFHLLLFLSSVIQSASWLSFRDPINMTRFKECEKREGVEVGSRDTLPISYHLRISQRRDTSKSNGSFIHRTNFGLARIELGFKQALPRSYGRAESAAGVHIAMGLILAKASHLSNLLLILLHIQSGTRRGAYLHTCTHCNHAQGCFRPGGITALACVNTFTDVIETT